MEKELCPATVPLSIGPLSTQIILLRMSWWLFSMMKQDPLPLPLLLMGYSNLKQKPKLNYSNINAKQICIEVHKVKVS